MIIAWQLPPQDSKRQFDSMHIHYMVIDYSLDNTGLLAYLKTYPAQDSQHINNEYTLYRIGGTATTR